MAYPKLNVPDRVKQWIEEAMDRNGLEHPVLLFYRYLDGEAENTKNRGDQLRYVSSKAQSKTLSFYRSRQDEACLYLSKQGFEKYQFNAVLSSRLAAGLGIPSPFENGISLQHIHGFPYIPGSSIKGIAQEYALCKGYNVGDNPEKRLEAQNDLRFMAVFGAQSPARRETQGEVTAHRGSVLFLDAVPSKDSVTFDVDVMTPHYGEYYASQGKIGKAPADYCDPNPVTFLTVASGTGFQFSILAQDYRDAEGTVQRAAAAILKDAGDWLRGALAELGAGGKTSVGYGRFHRFS